MAILKMTLTKIDGGQTKTIDIQIDENGLVKATVNGIDGPACTGFSEFLDQLGTVEVDENTLDYFQMAMDQDTDFLGGGF